MIIGIGSDMVSIERIEGTIKRFGVRFVQRVFSDTEKKTAEYRAATVETYAKRWAAKEACSKALGTGLRMGVAWKEMRVKNLPTGQPEMELTGGAKERLSHLTPDGHTAKIHVTLTDDHPWAQAFVIIEAVPNA